MKTKVLTLALFGLLFQIPLFAQDKTTVKATNNEISDNLDLRAVASIFGDAKDLQDFEQRLNDPKNKISNLDLNFDRQVDYLRVIEAVEKNTHLIILQAVLEKDVFQDVATIEVERDRNNQVQIQVVGDVFMYGPNYIYEPVYIKRPIIYNVFWVNNYNPYCSPYYYNYYPTYYYAWTPYPIYRYRKHIHVHINEYNYYNYSDHRRSERAVAMYEPRRRNGYESNYDNYSTRRTNYASTRNESTRNNTSIGRNEQSGGRNQTTQAPSRNSIENTNVTGVRNENSNNGSRGDIKSPATRGNENTSVRPNRVSQNAAAMDNSNTSIRNNSIQTPNRSLNSSEPRPRMSNAPSNRELNQNASGGTRNTNQNSGNFTSGSRENSSSSGRSLNTRS